MDFIQLKKNADMRNIPGKEEKKKFQIHSFCIKDKNNYCYVGLDFLPREYKNVRCSSALKHNNLSISSLSNFLFK